MRVYSLIILLSLSFSNPAQKRTATVMIKQIKSSSWSCPDQQTDFKVYTLSDSLSYDQRKKTKEVLKDRFKSNNDKNKILSYDVSLNQNDFLVIYEYYYQYSDKRRDGCTTNERRLIKGFPIGDLTQLDAKMQQKLNNNSHAKKYLRHKIIEIQIPFGFKDPTLLESMTSELRKIFSKTEYISTEKARNSTGIGVHG